MLRPTLAFRRLAAVALGAALSLSGALAGCHQEESTSSAQAIYDINWLSANGPTTGPVQVREGYHATAFTVVSCPKFLDWYRLSDAMNRKTKAEIRAAIAESVCTPHMVIDGSIYFGSLAPSPRGDHSTDALQAEVLTAAREVWQENDWSFDRMEAMGGIRCMLHLTSHDAEWSPESVHAYTAALSRGFAAYAKTLSPAEIALGTGN